MGKLSELTRGDHAGLIFRSSLMAAKSVTTFQLRRDRRPLLDGASGNQFTQLTNMNEALFANCSTDGT